MSSPEYYKAISFSNELEILQALEGENIVDHEQYLLQVRRDCILVLGFVERVANNPHRFQTEKP